jgi:hypothetical protein
MSEGESRVSNILYWEVSIMVVLEDYEKF